MWERGQAPDTCMIPDEEYHKPYRKDDADEKRTGEEHGGMVRGTRKIKSALRDEQDCAPVGRCGRCAGEIYEGENVYNWEGREICPDCFKAVIAAWLNEDANGLAAALEVVTRLLGGGG